LGAGEPVGCPRGDPVGRLAAHGSAQAATVTRGGSLRLDNWGNMTDFSQDQGSAPPGATVSSALPLDAGDRLIGANHRVSSRSRTRKTSSVHLALGLLSCMFGLASVATVVNSRFTKDLPELKPPLPEALAVVSFVDVVTNGAVDVDFAVVPAESGTLEGKPTKTRLGTGIHEVRFRGAAAIQVTDRWAFGLSSPVPLEAPTTEVLVHAPRALTGLQVRVGDSTDGSVEDQAAVLVYHEVDGRRVGGGLVHRLQGGFATIDVAHGLRGNVVVELWRDWDFRERLASWSPPEVDEFAAEGKELFFDTARFLGPHSLVVIRDPAGAPVGDTPLLLIREDGRRFARRTPRNGVLAIPHEIKSVVVPAPFGQTVEVELKDSAAVVVDRRNAVALAFTPAELAAGASMTVSDGARRTLAQVGEGAPAYVVESLSGVVLVSWKHAAENRFGNSFVDLVGADPGEVVPVPLIDSSEPLQIRLQSPREEWTGSLAVAYGETPGSTPRAQFGLGQVAELSRGSYLVIVAPIGGGERLTTRVVVPSQSNGPDPLELELVETTSRLQGHVANLPSISHSPARLNLRPALPSARADGWMRERGFGLFAGFLRHDGSFSIRSVPDGLYSLQLERDGFELARGNIELRAGEPLVLRLDGFRIVRDES